MKPIGATQKAPLVVKTEDIAGFVRNHITVTGKGKPEFQPMLTQIEMAKENGQIVNGVSYDILKRIYREDAFLTSEVVSEEILVSFGSGMMLGREIPVYRNPEMSDGEFHAQMKMRLTEEGETDPDLTWNKERDTAFIESFPKLEMPL